MPSHHLKALLTIVAALFLTLSTSCGDTKSKPILRGPYNGTSSVSSAGSNNPYGLEPTAEGSSNLAGTWDYVLDFDDDSLDEQSTLTLTGSGYMYDSKFGLVILATAGGHHMFIDGSSWIVRGFLDDDRVIADGPILPPNLDDDWSEDDEIGRFYAVKVDPNNG